MKVRCCYKLTPLAHEQSTYLRLVKERWPSVYKRSHEELRSRVWELVRNWEPLPIWEGEVLDDNDWLCFADTDDWHSPEAEVLVKEAVSPSVDFLWFEICAVRWVSPAHYDSMWRHYGQAVPHPLGIALRYGVYRCLNDYQLELLLNDHANSVTHAVHFGLSCRYVPQVLGVWNVNPSSVSVAVEFRGLPQKVARDYKESIRSRGAPPWVLDRVETLASLFLEAEK